MPETFRSPRSYHPSYSLLGRAVRAWVGHRLRGEALYIVVLTGLALALLMSHYLGWALLKPYLTSHPSWQAVFWGGQVVSVLLLSGVGLIGFQPAVRVTCTADTIELRQGPRATTLPYDSIRALDTITSVQYHRHYRRYAATTAFISALPDEVILLRTADGPVVVALSPSDAQRALRDRIEAEMGAAPEPAPPVQS